MEKVESKLIEIINEIGIVKLDNSERVEELDLINKLGMNSLVFIQFLVSIEEKFGIEIPSEELLIDNLKYFNNLKNVIIKQLGEE